MDAFDISHEYERKFLELLLRHELPGNCDVRVTVDTPDGSAAATFALRDRSVEVKSEIGSLNLSRGDFIPGW